MKWLLMQKKTGSEMFARVICMQMGTKSEICLYPMTGKQMKETSVHHTVTLAYEIGKSIGDARVKGTDPLEGIVDYFKNSFDKRFVSYSFKEKLLIYLEKLQMAGHEVK